MAEVQAGVEGGSVEANASELAALPLFASATEETRARIAALCRVESHPAGFTIFSEGDLPRDVYVLLDGRVTLCMRLPCRPERCFLSLRPGELLGWSALLGRRRVATARAATPCRLLRVEGSGLLSLCEEDARVGYAVMRDAFEALADRLQGTRLQLFDLYGPGA